MLLIQASSFLILLLLPNANGFYIATPAYVRDDGSAHQHNYKIEKSSYEGITEKLSSKCLACRFVVPVLRLALRAGLSSEEITGILVGGCKIFHIEKPDVCDGIASEFSDEGLTALRNSTLSALEICSFIYGDSCPSDFDDKFMWNLTLPNVPKPPVSPSFPPVPGAPKLRVLHISDIHVDFRYRIGSNAACDKPLCCQDGDAVNAANFKPAGKWGDYLCDVPPWTIENLFQHLSNEKPFDYILWTGDLNSHAVWNISRSEALFNLDYITKLFLKHFPGVPVFSSAGNHESVPVNSFPPSYVTGDRSIAWLYDGFANNWTHWLSKDTALTIERGGYYTSLLKPGFRIVSLNMNYCNSQNLWLMINLTDPMGQLDWLSTILQNAENTGEKVQIVGHIPPGDSGCLKWWSWNYYAIVSRYEGVIAGQFFGHVHVDTFKLFYDVADGFKRPVSVAYCGPSVTTFWQLNMGYRIYDIDGFYPNSSWSVLDHETFIMNLTDANLSDNPRWIREYSAKETYNISSLSAAEWDRVFKQLITDDELFDSYYRLYNKLHLVKPCDKTCRRRLLCEMKSGRSHDPAMCSGLFDDPSTTPREQYDRFQRWQSETKSC